MSVIVKVTDFIIKTGRINKIRTVTSLKRFSPL